MFDRYFVKIKYQYKSKTDLLWHDCPLNEVNPYLKYAYEIRITQDFKNKKFL